MRDFRILGVIVGLVLVGWFEEATAATLTTLHSFTGLADGSQPLAGLVEGSDSNFYGTASEGGVFASGIVFKISPGGTLTTLYRFTGGTDGASPQAGLVEGSDSNFYGTTHGGGTIGSGTVFKISSAETLTSLWSFTGAADGSQPLAGLVEGSDSNFYGTTFGGGSSGLGAVFKITSAGTLTPLWNFAGAGDGSQPSAGLVEGTNGIFYGTTVNGGLFGSGTVFKITSARSLTSLWSFTGGLDGANPRAGLVEGSDGSFYGTTAAGGTNDSGTLFKITPSGSLTPLWIFGGGGDGANPQATLIEAGDGDFYGTTFTGGFSGFGTVFKISPSGRLRTLHDFTGGTDGANPPAGLVQGSVSNFYGTTSAGGIGSNGTVFTLIQPCTYTLSPSHVLLPAISFSNTFNVTASSTNCPWTAVSRANWITITSATNGTGDGTVAYSVAANTNASVNSRVGIIIVAGKTFTVTQQPFVLGRFLQGKYNGLVIDTNAPSQASSGSISLVLNKTGSFAAKLKIGGVQSSFRGQFDASGNATNTVTPKNLSPLQVTLHLLDVTNATDQLTGTVSGGVTSEFLADLAIFSRVNPSPFAGRYTFVIAPADSSDSTVPQGYGYGALTVSSNGSGHLQGSLGDGTSVNATVPISGYGTWPFFDSLYKNQGSSIGWLTIDTNNTVGASVDWFKPALLKNHLYPTGFVTTVTLTGDLYASPTAGGPSIAGAGTLTLGGGNLTSNLVKSVLIDALGHVTVSPADSDRLTLKIRPATGQFSGSFLNPAIGRRSTLGGVLLQPDNSGAGLFLGTNQSGFVTLAPPP